MKEITNQRLQRQIQAIKTEIIGAHQKFVAVGYYLAEIEQEESYKQEGYEDLWSFAEDHFQIGKSSTSRFIAIYKKFGQEGLPLLQDKYLEYGQAKLAELLTLPDIIAEEIPPEASRNQIRETKQLIKEEKTEENNETPLLGLEIARVLKELYKREPFTERLKEVQAVILDDPQEDKFKAAITGGTGFAQGRAAGHYIFLKEDDITIMDRSQQKKESISYLTAMKITSEEMTWGTTWEETYLNTYDIEPPKPIEPPKEPPKQEKPKKEPQKQEKGPQKPIENTKEEPVAPAQQNNDSSLLETAITEVEKKEISEQIMEEITEENQPTESITQEPSEESEETEEMPTETEQTEPEPTPQITEEIIKTESGQEVVSPKECLACKGKEISSAYRNGFSYKVVGITLVLFEKGESVGEVTICNCPNCGKKL